MVIGETEMAFRILYFLFAIFILANAIIFVIGNITNTNLYEKYSKELRISFWGFLLIFLILLVIGIILTMR